MMRIRFVLPFMVDGVEGHAEKWLELVDPPPVPFGVRVHAGPYEYSSPVEDLIWDEREGFVLRFGEVLEFSQDPAARPPATALSELLDPQWGWTVHIPAPVAL
jgi:hypothetical protein